MSKKELLDKWCRESRPGLIPAWYHFSRVSKQGDFMFVYFIMDTFHEEVMYQFRFSDFLTYYRNHCLNDLLDLVE
jgi:hypothetical protein